jgi:hypothetical protein
MTDTTHRAFFGDGERAFCLTAELIPELERLTGSGIGAIARRIIERDFTHADMLQTIRLALIGGGETPQRAAELVATYGAPRPLYESHALAFEIINALWFGTKAKSNGKA